MPAAQYGPILDSMEVARMPDDDAPRRGEHLRPGDDGYDAARAVFNAMIDRRPALIIRCADADDVATGIGHARRNHLPLSVKGGGHSVAGTAVCDGGVMLDLSPMRQVTVDFDSATVTAQGGVTLGDLDRATAAHGQATPTGIVSVTGLSGLALGGGLGWLNGAYGLTCDNLVAAEVVTADGECLTASEDEHPDLFWALRGGGGNFGVVTSFTLRLHRVDEVLAGTLGFSGARAHDALAAYHRLARHAPDELTINASVHKTPDDRVGAAMSYCHLGTRRRLDDLLAELRAIGPATDNVAVTRFVDLQSAADGGFPEGQQHYWKSASITDVDDSGIAALLDAVKAMPSLASGVGFQQLHGAAARVDPTATAYAHRRSRCDFLILSQWPDPATTVENVAWTNDTFATMSPFVDQAVYVNNLGNEGASRVREAYGPNYERLAEIKRVYDPTNLFRHNHNIVPGDHGQPQAN
jgi:FAD/FMN-containing dehydrogenase